MASFSSFSVRGSEGEKSSFCSSLYNEIIIDDEKKMNIWHILICTLSLVLTLLAYALFRRNQSVSTKNNRINKNAILPLYQKLLLFYILSVTFTLFLWCLEFSFDSCWTSQSKYWWLTILCAFQTSLKRFFELFIALFISGKSSGLIAIKQSIWRSLVVSILLFIIYFFMYSAGYIAYPFQAEVFYIVSELIYFSILLSILWYCCCHHWLRMSNIYILLISTLVLESLYIISWLMVRLSFDGYCLNDIGDLLGIIIFPILIIYVIRADSYFWRTIFQRLSASTRITKSFGGSRKSFQQLSTRLSDEGGRFGYTPMADFLSMQVPIIDFANLKVGTNPVGHGSTSMVYPALLDSSRLVAAKVFSLDRITIKSVADFFRETLLSAEIDHPNVVKFVGCCIRPPEICLVYEICSHGDLASFIFSQNKALLEYSTYASTFTLNTARTDGNGLHKRDGSGYDIESTEFNVESTETPQLPLRGMEYQTVTLLSDNTTIPSAAASPLTSQRLAPQPQKTSVISVGAYKKPFDSPTDDSTINTNKYANDMQPHDEIINSLKAKMANMEYNGQTMGGSVSISATNVLLNLRLRLFLLFDISKGMAFLHKRNILHRDLKTANVLLHFEPEQGRFLAKVCDFGSSRNAYATMADSESKKGTHRVREDLSLTNYKNAKALKHKNKSQTKSKRIPQILANVRKLKLNKSSETVRTKNVKQNPFHYAAVPRTASITDDSAFDEHELPSASMTATSTRFDTTTAGNTYGVSSKSELLPEPIRTLSSVAYTAPENLGHIDFSAYERASLSRKNLKDAKPYYNKTKKKFTVTKCEDVIVTPVTAQFERNVLGMSMSVEKHSEDREVSVASEPIEMNDDGMSKDMSHRIGMREEIDLKTAFKADVFSFAVIIWEVICMKPIYEEMNMIQIRDMILSGKRMNLTDFDDLIYLNPNKSKKDGERNRYKKIQQLMTDCWQQNAKFRPNFEEIVKIISCIIYDK